MTRRLTSAFDAFTILMLLIVLLSGICFGSLLVSFALDELPEDCLTDSDVKSRELIAEHAYLEGLEEGRRGGHQEAFNNGKKWGYREACIRCCEHEGPGVVASFDPVTGGCLCATQLSEERL